MEKQTKPQNIYIRRNRALTAFAAIAFFACGAAIAIAFPLAIIKTQPKNDVLIKVAISLSVIAAVLIYLAILNMRNLFFPFLLVADEKGVYNYSGFFHYGFIPWENIENFNNDANWLDVLDDSTPNIKICVKDFKNYKKSVSFYRKWLLFWSMGDIRIYTLCSQVKKKEAANLLTKMLADYGSAQEGEPTELLNGK